MFENLIQGSLVMLGFFLLLAVIWIAIDALLWRT